MKVILFLLLLTCSVCYGQVGDSLWTIFGTPLQGKLGTIDVEAVFIDSKWSSHKVPYESIDFLSERIITFEVLLQYAEECYNDSALHRIHVGGSGDGDLCIVDYECLVDSHYRNKYIHRKPTLEGFIEWLKKK